MKIKLISTLAILLSVSACTATSNDSNVAFAADDASKLVGHSYEVEKINGEVYIPLENNQKPTLKFSMRNGKLYASGNATCNNYNGTVKQDISKFIVAPIMTTRMMCAGGGTVTERDFLKLLGEGSDLTIQGTKIKLDSGRYSLTFKEI